jgi:hypothetical protein
MNARQLTVTLSLISCFASAQTPAPQPATPADAKATPPAETTPPPANPPKRKLLKYTPPQDTASGKRLDGDGGSRDEKQYKLPNWLYTLTPQSGKGLTTMAQPSLFTFQDKSANMVYLVKILEPGKPQEIFTYAGTNPAAGIHRVDLSQFDITLKPGVDYEWVVALRPDQKKKSSDLVARGSIRRVEPDAALAEKINSANPADLPAIYAEAGIWYDVLSSLDDQINANRKSKELVTVRNQFLKDAGIDVVNPPKPNPKVGGSGGEGAGAVKPQDPKPKVTASKPRTDGDQGSR